MPSGFDYKKVLVIGATSGIGKGLAEKLLQEGRNVIIVGRRESLLDDFIQANKHYGPTIDKYVFDVTKLGETAAWAKNVTSEHPDLDAVWINSGVQRGFNFSDPETVDLKVFEQELSTNYTSVVYITQAFLPHLIKKKNAAVIYTSSGLAFVPWSRCLNYCATKAALHHFAIGLREHLRSTGVRVIEAIPPAVQTELHDAKHQPDIAGGASIGMPLKDYIEEQWAGIIKGNEYDEYPVENAARWYGAIEPTRKKLFKLLPQGPAGQNFSL